MALIVPPSCFAAPWLLPLLLFALLISGPARAQVVVANLNVGGAPVAMAVNPVSGKTYVVNGESQVTVLTGPGTSAATIDLGSGATTVSVAVNPLTGKVYVPFIIGSSYRVAVIDDTNSHVDLAILDSPANLAVNPVTNKVYIAGNLGNRVTVIDGATNGVSTVDVGGPSYDIAVNPVSNRIYVVLQSASNVNGSVVAINGADNSTTSIGVGKGPDTVVVNPVTNRIYVGNFYSSSVTVIDGSDNSTTTVAATEPHAMAVNPVTNKVYVAGYSNNRVTVIDGDSNATTPLTVGAQCYGVAVNSVTNQIYVTARASNELSIIDGASNAVSSVGVGTLPRGVAVNPITNRIYVANTADHTVSIIDGDRNLPGTPFAASAIPFNVAVDPIAGRAYVTNQGANSVTVIDAGGAVQATLLVGAGPRAIAANPVTGKVYVANHDGGTVTVIDGANNDRTTVNVGTNPADIAINLDTNRIYVVNEGSSNLTVIDGVSNATATVATGSGPTGVAVNPSTNKVYVANYQSNSITVVDGADNSSVSVPTDAIGYQVAVNRQTNKVYVSNVLAGKVTVLDGATDTVSGSITTGSEPYELLVDERYNVIYVARLDGASIVAIDGASGTTTTVGVGLNPFYMALNPLTRKLYVSNYNSASVSVIDGTTLATSTIPLSGKPYGIDVNPVTGKVYVANYGAGNVSVINTAAATMDRHATSVTMAGGHATAYASPTLSLSVAGAYAPSDPDLTGMYYQVNTVSGRYSSATGTGPYTATPAALPRGVNFVSAFALDALAGSSFNVNGAASGGIGTMTGAPTVFAVAVVAPGAVVIANGNPDPSPVNASLQFNATVTGLGPTGTVAFTDGAQTIPGCAAVALTGSGNSRSASCTTGSLAVGTRSIRATYSGDSVNPGSTSAPVSQVIAAPGFTFAPVSLPSATVGVPGYLAAVSATPGTGAILPVSYAVTPNDAALPPGLAPSPVSGLLISGTPSAAGTFTFGIRASDSSGVGVGGPFSGERSYSITVARGSQSITFAPLPERSLAAGPFTLGASASSGLAAAYASLSNSTCTVSGTTLTPVAPGLCTVRASQAGDGNWLAASDVDRSFNVLAASGVALTSSGTSIVNTQITLTATVTGTAPTGSVQFRDGGTPIGGCGAVAFQPGSGDLRSAQCQTSALQQGLHSLTAAYSGDGNNTAVTSAVFTQNVQKPAFVFSPSSSVLPAAVAESAYGPVVISATGTGVVSPVQYFTEAAPPLGLSLNQATGELSGTPQEGGSFTIAVFAQDSSTAAVGGPFVSTTRNYSLTITIPTTVAIGAITPSPCLTGQSCQVPVTVTAAIGTPGGTVNVSDGAGGSCSVPLSAGAGSCTFTPTTTGTRAVSANYTGQAPHSAASTSVMHGFAAADVAPTVSYSPTTGTTVGLTGAFTQLGSAADGQVGLTVGGGLGNGSVSLGCSVSGGTFSLTSAPSVNIAPGSTPGPIQVRCTRTAFVQAGPGMTLNCTETSSPGGAQRNLSWPLSCPAATAVPPTLSYSPAPDNTIVFPTGVTNADSNTSIQVTGSGAVGNGSTNLSCTLPAGDAAFSIVSGNNQTVTTSTGAGPLGLRCLLSAAQRTSTLTCVETEGPVVAQRTRTWPLTCPPGQPGTTAKLTVGTRVVTRGHAVSVPVTFAGEGSTTSVVAQINYDNSKLPNPRAVGAAGGGCTVMATSNAITVTIPSLGAALPVNDTRYCELQFNVPTSAPSGPLPLAILQANCIDGLAVSRLCAKSDGRIAVAALSPQPPDSAAIVIDGHVSDVDRIYAVKVTNDGTAARAINACTLSSANPNLGLSATPALPLTIQPSQTATLTVQCHLPPLGQQYAGTLSCTTDDPMRGIMSYDVRCKSSPDGAELSSDQLLNDQLRAGEQQGRSAALGATSGNNVVALGAPFGGASGDGRVALYESAPTAGKGAVDGRPGLRLLASLEALAEDKTERRGKALTALVTEQQGQAVAIRPDGGEIAVGAPNAPTDGSLPGPGRVYRYVRPPGGWSTFNPEFDLPVVMNAQPVSTISPGGFGSAVAYASNGDLLVGAPGSSVPGTSGAGAVFAYTFTGLCPVARVHPETGAACIAGASLFDDPPQVTSTPSPSSSGNFGAALAVTSAAVFVGAPSELVAPVKPGNVYRVDYIAGSFGAPVRLVPTSVLATNDKLGSALAVAGDLLLVGSPGADNAAGTDAGAVLVFRNLAAPTQVGVLLPGTGATQAAGTAIAVSGSSIYVGAPTYSSVGHSGVGRVYAYPLKASYTMAESPTATLDDALNHDGDDFGRSLAVGTELAVIGVPKADATLFDGTALTDTGRADPFALAKPDAMFANGFE